MRTLDSPQEITEEHPDEQVPRRRRRGRKPATAGRAFIVVIVSLLLWSLLAAPSLKRAAEASPDGIRRSVSLAVLTPLEWTSERLRVSVLGESLQRALGRDPEAPPGGEVFTADPEPIPENFGVAPEVIATPPDNLDLGRTEPSDPLRVPTPRDKLRIVVVGDSLSMGLSTALSRLFNPSLVQYVGQGRLSTGLARADYFNWVKGMEQISERFRPDLVVVLIGSNDDQAIVYPDGSAFAEGGGQWADAYEERAQKFLDAATGTGGRVVWVGLPPMPDGADNRFAKSLNETYEEVAGDVPRAAYLDTYGRFSRDGKYAPFGRDANGNVAQLRAGDGVHFTPVGYDALAREIVETATEEWGLPQEVVQN